MISLAYNSESLTKTTCSYIESNENCARIHTLGGASPSIWQGNSHVISLTWLTCSHFYSQKQTMCTVSPYLYQTSIITTTLEPSINENHGRDDFNNANSCTNTLQTHIFSTTTEVIPSIILEFCLEFLSFITNSKITHACFYLNINRPSNETKNQIINLKSLCTSFSFQF